MSTPSIRRALPLACCCAWLVAGAPAPLRAEPLSTAFTYQGELYDTGVPALGSYDIRFAPYADAANPTLLAAPVVVEDVVVSDGVFTAQVDFGAGFFVGDAVYLEIALRPFDSADPGAFQPLAPRQAITASPYSLKPAAGSVTDIELAADAVGSPQLADNSITTADVGDGALLPQDLALASGAFDASLWRVGGNTGSAGVGLGTLDNQPLSLFSPVGVTLNGARFNNSTELTVRGNTASADTNADLTLWPRGGGAFFNLGVIGSTTTDTRLQIHAVGISPFTGYDARAQMNFDGALGLGGNDPAPQARLHVTRNDIGFDAPADSSEALELVLEDTDAQLGLYSDSGGGAGSVIGLGELDAGAFVDQWGLFRRTAATGSALQLSYGTNSAAAGNPVLFNFGTNASLALGAFAPNSDTELYVSGSPSTVDTDADLSLQPRNGSHLFNLSVAGTNETDTSLALQFAGPGANYAPRLRVTGTGSFAAGKNTTLAHGGSFVFADDSNLAPVATTAANQFLVRATGGVALNSSPLLASYELNVSGSASGESAELAMRAGGSTGSFLTTVDGADAASMRWRLLRRDAVGGSSFISRLWIGNNGFLSVNGAFADPAFPLIVGTNTTNGNGARLTAGGVWTNGSSRAFKQAFTALDVGDVLERVLSLSITRWQYRGGSDGWHMGPVAEDFRAAFGLGDSERYIGTVDADGVALAAIQGLHARSEARAAQLQQENAGLRAALDALAQRVAALEQAH